MTAPRAELQRAVREVLLQHGIETGAVKADGVDRCSLRTNVFAFSKIVAKLGVLHAPGNGSRREVFSHRDPVFTDVQGVISRVRWEVLGTQ
jgi:hypothetical protein